MTIDWMIVATVLGPVLGVIVGVVLTRALEEHANLIAYYGHASSFRVATENPFWVYTHSVVVRNAGKRPANNVRLSHATLPVNYTVYPEREIEIVELPGGTKDLVIARLVPGEQITVSYLYYPPLTWNQVNTGVKSDEGFAKVITVLPQQQYPRWIINTLRVLVVIGVISVLYLLVTAGLFLLPWARG